MSTHSSSRKNSPRKFVSESSDTRSLTSNNLRFLKQSPPLAALLSLHQRRNPLLPSRSPRQLSKLHQAPRSHQLIRQQKDEKEAPPVLAMSHLIVLFLQAKNPLVPVE
ncbi:hypothetical protein LB505_001928 [Fusarium chuoi]|nr:hypothetical protein LB505_001928 [Fusarium chuoi]